MMLVQQTKILFSRHWNILLGLFIGVLFAYLGGLVSAKLILIAVLAVCFAAAVFIFPEFGLLVTIAIIPLERFGRFTDDSSEFSISLMRIMGILVLGTLIIHNLSHRKQFVFGKPFFIYAAYILLVIISLTYTTDKVGTTRAVASYIANLMFFFLLINLIRSKKIIVQSLIIWLSVSVAIGIYSVYDWYFGSGASETTYLGGELDPGKGAQVTAQRWSTIWVDTSENQTLGGKSLKRTMGSTSHSAVYGINLVLTIPFFVFFLKMPIKASLKFLIYCALGIILYNILLTNTRATILLAIVVLFLCVYRGLFKITLPMVLVALLSIPVIISVIPQDVYNRVLDVQNYTFDKSESLRIREKYFYAGIKSFSENWLLGMGAENENIIPQNLDPWIQAPKKTTVHNQYLQTLIELGIVGFIIHYGFIFLLLYYCSRSVRIFRRIKELQQEYYLMISIQISMIATLIYAIQVEVFQFPLKGWWFLSALTVVMYYYSLQYSNRISNKDEQ